MGAVVRRSGAAWAAASTLMVMRHSSSLKEILLGIQLIESVVVVWVARMADTESQIVLQVVALL
jgi:hypothetical protein